MLALFACALMAFPSAFGASPAIARTAPFYGNRIASGSASTSSCGGMNWTQSQAPRFTKATGTAVVSVNASSASCATTSPAYLDYTAVIGLRSELLTVKHAISNETAVWNFTFNLTLHVHQIKPSTTYSEIELSAMCAFSRWGGFSFGHGFTQVVYQTDRRGNYTQSTAGDIVRVYNAITLPAGSTVRVYNWIELDLRLYTDAPATSQVSAAFDLATGGHQAQLVSWSLR